MTTLASAQPGLAATYATCRRLRHAWEELGGPPLDHSVTVAGSEEPFWVRCVRCSMVRVTVYSAATGFRTYGRYYPPPGYYWAGEPGGAPTQADFWLDRIRERRRRG